MKDEKHGRLKILGLFGAARGFLYKHWPRVSREGRVTGFMPEAAAEALIAACCEAGVWDVYNRVRGRGAWLEDDGRLAWHCGDTIWLGPDEQRKPGPTPGGRHVYPSAPPVPRPSEAPASCDQDTGPAWRVLELFKTWAWKRGDLDAILLLGWVGCGMAGGALKWRPMCWLTGDRGTGKSSLHDCVKYLNGEAIVASSDASAAGIYQQIGHQSIPVALDEIEAKDDNRKVQNIIELARQAASSGVLLRGNPDHIGSQFQARSCFLFSSVLIPPLLSQDISRLAILELGALTTTSPPPLSAAIGELMDIGRQLRRRIADGWARWPETLECWRQQLVACGHTGRGADQFGTLLAMADILLYDVPPETEVLRAWTERLSPASLAAQSDDAPDHERCLHHILSTPADLWRGGAKFPLARYVRRVAQIDPVPDEKIDYNEARDVLGNAGLRVESLMPVDGTDAVLYLLIANQHQGLSKIFEGTHWASRSGSASAWRQSLIRIDGARALSDLMDARGRAIQTMRFGGVSCRGVAVPILSWIDGED
ncbi:MAG: hypothetical protein OEQ29_25205 [Alphaproteobacteria bacterium]|nr:hypothetical protein [Alphaproteobacteria bacterium]